MPFDDGQVTILLNTKCSKEKVPEELKTFYAYLNEEEVAEDDPFIVGIHNQVEEVNQSEEVQTIMTLAEEMYFREIKAREDGLAEGIEKGIEKGLAEGEAKLNRLIRKLLETGRIEDLERSTKDPEYQKKLFEEFGL